MYMEIIFSELKRKEVINIADGKHLGRICDIKFTFPGGQIDGFLLTGGKGFKLTKQDIYMPLKCITKIGEDAVLVNLQGEQQPNPPPNNQNCPPLYPPAPQSRRSLDEYE